jgi:DNA-directed RNA polymerase subunit RPC12/RpoP
MNYYCKYCGSSFSSVSALTANTCQRHPSGAGKGKHALYEGGEKKQFTCKFCGSNFSSLSALTANTCQRHPNGSGKGRHEAAL